MYRAAHSPKKAKTLFPLAAIALSIAVFVLSGLVKIKQVDCFTQFGPCRADYAQALSWAIGYPILRPMPAAKVKQSLKNFSDIKTISVYRRLPSVLVVSIALRSPIGLVSSSVLGSYSVVDDSGFVYSSSSPENYPILILPNMPKTNTFLDSQSVAALKSLALMGNLTDKKISGYIQGDSLVATISGETETVIGLSSPQEQWYTPLQLILNRSKMRGKMPRKIDLRFDSSVISY